MHCEPDREICLNADMDSCITKSVMKEDPGNGAEEVLAEGSVKSSMM